MPKYLRSTYAGLAIALVVLSGCEDGTSGPTRGDLRVEISGLPSGAAAAVTITGPNAFSQVVTSSTTLDDLKAGSYQVTASNVTAGAGGYGAVNESQGITITGGQQQTVGIEYVNLNTTLTVTVRPHLSGARGALRVTGPGGFDRTFTNTTRLAGLQEGSYMIAGSGAVVGDSTYQAQPVRQEYVMTGLFPGSATVSFGAAGHRSLNFRITGLHLLNAVQTPNGTIPLIQNRDALIRVFATADQANTATPWVRVRVYDGASLLETMLLSPGSASVVMANAEGEIERSWNAIIPASLVRSGLRIDAEIDPDNGIIESNETDNAYPASGAGLTVSVVSPPPLQIRFVPVRQAATGLTGDVTEANKESYLGMSRRVFPIPTQIESSVGPTYTYTGGALGADGTNWVELLGQMESLRVAESLDTHPVGVVKVGYSSGVAGIAFIQNNELGGPALVWDDSPSRSEFTAHELGHAFGRRHAPCGNPAGPDNAYPYSAGAIGVYGYDIVNSRLRRPDSFDLMGYCLDPWISDYTYEAIRNFRAAAVQTRQSQRQSTLLVWGRIGEDQLVLEPAFQITARPAMPSSTGPYQLEGLDVNGATLFSFSFAGKEVADVESDERIFAFAVPWTADRAARLATMRLRGNGREATVRASPTSSPLQISATRAPGGVQLSWNQAEHPMLMVREPGTGRVLSFARGGQARLSTNLSELEIVSSNGPRSMTNRLEVDPN